MFEEEYDDEPTVAQFEEFMFRAAKKGKRGLTIKVNQDRGNRELFDWLRSKQNREILMDEFYEEGIMSKILFAKDRNGPHAKLKLVWKKKPIGEPERPASRKSLQSKLLRAMPVPEYEEEQDFFYDDDNYNARAPQRHTARGHRDSGYSAPQLRRMEPSPYYEGGHGYEEGNEDYYGYESRSNRSFSGGYEEEDDNYFGSNYYSERPRTSRQVKPRRFMSEQRYLRNPNHYDDEEEQDDYYNSYDHDLRKPQRGNRTYSSYVPQRRPSSRRQTARRSRTFRKKGRRKNSTKGSHEREQRYRRDKEEQQERGETRRKNTKKNRSVSSKNRGKVSKKDSRVQNDVLDDEDDGSETIIGYVGSLTNLQEYLKKNGTNQKKLK